MQQKKQEKDRQKEEARQKTLEIQKQQRDLKREKQEKQIQVSLDVKTFGEQLKQKFGSYGTVATDPTLLANPKIIFTISFEKKEEAQKARQTAALQLPVHCVVDGTPIEDYSVHFPFLWADEKDSSKSLSGKEWLAVKQEIVSVFTSKIPKFRPQSVVVISSNVVVSFENETGRQQALQLTQQGDHNWVVKTKKIPSLKPGFPVRPVLTRKRKHTSPPQQGAPQPQILT